MSLTRRVERLEESMRPGGKGQELPGWPAWPPDGKLYVYLPSGERITAEEAMAMGFRVVKWVPWVPRHQEEHEGGGRDEP